jgi:hypothetical protein
MVISFMGSSFLSWWSDGWRVNDLRPTARWSLFPGRAALKETDEFITRAAVTGTRLCLLHTREEAAIR